MKQFIDTNKKRVGCFKDEINKGFISEFIGIRPKVYNMLTSEQKEKKVCKGVKKSVV